MNRSSGIALALLFAMALLIGLQQLRQKRAATEALIAQRSATLEKLQAHIAESLRFVSGHDQTGHDQGRVGFLDAETEADGTAELQSRLRRVLDEAQLVFVSSRVLPTMMQDNVQFVGIRLDGTGDLAALQRGLHRLEAAEPRMVVESAAIAAVPEPVGVAKSASRLLRWQLDVYAALWTTAP